MDLSHELGDFAGHFAFSYFHTVRYQFMFPLQICFSGYFMLQLVQNSSDAFNFLQFFYNMYKIFVRLQGNLFFSAVSTLILIGGDTS